MRESGLQSTSSVKLLRIRKCADKERGFLGASLTLHCEVSDEEWGVCALRHGIQISMEAILA